MSKHFSKLAKNSNANSRALLNPKWDKYKKQNKTNKKQTQVFSGQTAENQQQREKF